MKIASLNVGGGLDRWCDFHDGGIVTGLAKHIESNFGKTKVGEWVHCDILADFPEAEDLMGEICKLSVVEFLTSSRYGKSRLISGPDRMQFCGLDGRPVERPTPRSNTWVPQMPPIVEWREWLSAKTNHADGNPTVRECFEAEFGDKAPNAIVALFVFDSLLYSLFSLAGWLDVRQKINEQRDVARAQKWAFVDDLVETNDTVMFCEVDMDSMDMIIVAAEAHGAQVYTGRNFDEHGAQNIAIVHRGDVRDAVRAQGSGRRLQLDVGGVSYIMFHAKSGSTEGADEITAMPDAPSVLLMDANTTYTGPTGIEKAVEAAERSGASFVFAGSTVNRARTIFQTQTGKAVLSDRFCDAPREPKDIGAVKGFSVVSVRRSNRPGGRYVAGETTPSEDYPFDHAALLLEIK